MYFIKIALSKEPCFGYDLKEMVPCLVTQMIATTKRVQLSKTNSYLCKATATFIDRLSYLNMQDNEESRWRFLEYFFFSTVSDTQSSDRTSSRCCCDAVAVAAAMQLRLLQ